MDLKVEVEHAGKAVLVRLEGDLDKLTAPRLRGLLVELATAGPHELVVDVTALDFCDSSGLWVLVEHHRRLSTLGGTMRLSGVHGILQRVLEVTGLKAVFYPVRSP
ncbi:STAS domain-containing protein [Nonomuraea typhae]|uniref:STAS domain-containing protein n=1 Tax=Nonomuraea typhae TaxID=2603600 RepID=UPI0012FCAEA8|nr:STAS domain-containing protein [Nonomuraea typhae]